MTITYVLDDFRELKQLEPARPTVRVTPKACRAQGLWVGRGYAIRASPVLKSRLCGHAMAAGGSVGGSGGHPPTRFPLCQSGVGGMGGTGAYFRKVVLRPEENVHITQMLERRQEVG